MTAYYPIVIETESNGAVSAYVAGLPVYAAADTRAQAERAIRKTLAAYLDAHPATSPTTQIRVARVLGTPKTKGHTVVRLMGVAALLGTGRSATKAHASRANGRLGGRPRRADRKETKTARRT